MKKTLHSPRIIKVFTLSDVLVASSEEEEEHSKEHSGVKNK